AVGALGDVEVEQHRLAVGREQDVARLDVAVDHAAAVGVVQRLRQPLDDPGGGLEVARRPPLVPRGRPHLPSPPYSRETGPGGGAGGEGLLDFPLPPDPPPPSTGERGAEGAGSRAAVTSRARASCSPRDGGAGSAHTRSSTGDRLAPPK